MPEPAIDARAARRRFERAAASYARASRLETEIGARMLERLDYVKLAPRRVLDAGSGPGRDARLLARRYRAAGIVALDFAPAMLRAGKRRLFERNPPRAVCGDIARLPIASGSVDLVWSNMALHWAADAPAALREFHRVLAVGGLLMLSTLGPDTLGALRAAAGEGRVHRFVDMHDLGDALVAVGFAAPVMDMERLTLLYAGADALLEDLRASGQTGAAPGRARGLAGRRFLARLRDALDAQRRDGALPIGFEVVYGHAWKPEPKRAADGRAIVQFY
ncbi:MAG TPA: methyltransferase domain-containing protein [Burkholderiales bacterium]|nr:methyltransferase domain-containing protein [Burkholderiales bacterium]